MTNRQLLMAALLAASSLGATSAVAQTASPLSPGLHFLFQGPVKAAAQSESDDTKQATVLIDEDFSGLTAGSEDQPDGKKLVNDLGDFENPSLLRPYSSNSPTGLGAARASMPLVALLPSRTAGFSTPRPATWRAR